jgi:dCTP deaminase
MMLSDRDIAHEIGAGRIVIDPLDPDDIQPASVDVRLGDHFRWFVDEQDPVDLRRPNVVTKEDVFIGRPYVLRPAGFVLGVTVETVTLPDDLAARVDGKSSHGRCGLTVHATAGFIDPGFSGFVTLELGNDGPLDLELWPGMPVAQLEFHRLSSPCERPYGSDGLRSKYQFQRGATGPRSRA